MEQKPKVVYKYKNIAAALAVLLLILVAIDTHAVKASAKKTVKTKPDTSESQTEEASEPEAEAPRLTKNYKYEEFRNGDSLGNGHLVIVNEDHPYNGTPVNTEGVYLFLFDPAKTQIMYASTTNMEAEAETLTQFNKMAVDFVSKTNMRTLMVSGLIPEDDGAKYNEASAGTSVDLMLYDSYAGTFSEFSPVGEYSWIAENCAEYGFVLRGQNRLRFVGKPAAQYMKAANIDLEGFVDSVSSYSFESPLFYTDDEFEEYAIYYVPMSDGTTTNIPVPLREDDSEYSYTISGNNINGFIVIVDLSDNSSFEEYYEQSGNTAGEAEQ